MKQERNVGLGDAKITPYKMAQARKKAKAESPAEPSAERSIELQLPAFSYAGVSIDAMPVRIKAARNALEAPTLELKEEVLEYVRLAILEAGEDDEVQKRERVETGSKWVRYSVQKNAYIAKRVMDHNRLRFKTFNFSKKQPKGTMECMLKRARDWAENGATSGDEENDDDPFEGHVQWEAAGEDHTDDEASASVADESLAMTPSLRAVPSSTHLAFSPTTPAASATDGSPDQACGSLEDRVGGWGS